MTKNKICQNIFNIQRQFFESNKTINPKERNKSLKKLKSVISKNEEKFVVEGRGLHGLASPSSPLDFRNSGTSVRLCSGVLAAQQFSSILLGFENDVVKDFIQYGKESTPS